MPFESPYESRLFPILQRIVDRHCLNMIPADPDQPQQEIHIRDGYKPWVYTKIGTDLPQWLLDHDCSDHLITFNKPNGKTSTECKFCMPPKTYRLDFYLYNNNNNNNRLIKLNVECDGLRTHFNKSTDAIRDALLNRRGITVIRIPSKHFIELADLELEELVEEQIIKHL